jgi:pimeloyl-ACP methyl ester carboxylesterase
VQLSGYDLPLEFESTSAIAYALKDIPVFDFEIRGFFGLWPQLFHTKLSHLGTIEPYRRGKIPVVLVHGTASSVVRWGDLINEMMADPDIAQRYQLWIFTYNTGDPILFSAGILHQSLREAVQLFDPEGTDPALRKMVVIGHSQGGLLARLMVIESGTRFWDFLTKKSIDDLDVKPEVKEELRRSFFFTPLPFVRDVIFMATPHRGSYAAAGRIARWLADIVTLPAATLSTGLEVARVMAADEPRLASKLMLQIPRSVHSMDPSRPFTKVLTSIPIDPGVKVHSIIAVSGNKQLEADDDGIVTYQSAHITEALSEKVIHAGHSVQSHPEAIEEIRRILLDHSGAD